MQNKYSVVSHWPGDYDEAALQKWTEKLRSQLAAPSVSLGLVFMGPRFFEQAGRVLELLRVHGEIPLLAGCSSAGLIAGNREIEDDPGLVLGLFALPQAQLRAYHFTVDEVVQAQGAGYWPVRTEVPVGGTHGWLVFADPFEMDAEAWLKSWSGSYPKLPVLGGLASGRNDQPGTQLYLNGDVFEAGGVAIAFSGGVQLANVISQGCTPIGETWTITKVQENIIHEIGNRPAYQVLVDTFNQLSADQQTRARGNLFIGLAMDEYREEFHRGDFLIRNLIGADSKSGAIAVGAFPRPGQTLQFQRRDARAATEDLSELLDKAQRELSQRTVYGGCLCSCNGRGHRLFGYRNHDASMVESRLGPLGLAGFFCNGEIGPVGGRNFLHGYTASLALFASHD
jgi:small ligand-binding sensory domain FIST